MELPSRIYRSSTEDGYYTRYTDEEGRRVRIRLGDDKRAATHALELLREKLKAQYGLEVETPPPPPPKPRRPRVSLRALALRRLQSLRLQHVVYMLLLLALAGTLYTRIDGITSKPLWLDEVDQLCRAHHEFDFSEVIERAASHSQPPLDYLLVWQASRLYQYPPVIRIPYLLYGLGFCLLMWLWARRELGTLGMLVTAAWLVLSSFHIHYTQEIRMYALMMLLGAAYFYVLGTALLRRRAWWWMLCFVLATLNLYTNIFTGFTLALSGLYVVLWVLVHRHAPCPLHTHATPDGSRANPPARRPGIRTVLAAAAALLLAAACFAPFFFEYLRPTMEPEPMFEQGTLGVFTPWESLKGVIIDFAARPRTRLPYSWAYVTMLVLGCIPRRRREIPLCVTAALMLTAYPLGIAYLFSEFSNIAFKARYVCQAFPFFVLALTAGVVHCAEWAGWLVARIARPHWRARLRRVVTALVAVVLGALVLYIELPATFSQFRLEKSPWRTVTDLVKEDFADYSLITGQLDESLRWNLEWYMRPRANWRYVGLEELPKLFLERPVRLWAVVDERKLRAELPTLSNRYTITHVKAFYPSVYAMRSKRLLEWEEVLEAVEPLSDTMDPYAVATRQQYIWLGRARQAVRAGNPDAAVKAYRGALSISFKKDIWINLEFARYLRGLRRYEDAAEQYEVFFGSASPTHKLSVLEEMVDVYDTMNNSARADELLARHGSEELRTRRALQQRIRSGRRELNAKRPKQAYEQFRQAIDLDPTNVYVARTLAEICGDHLPRAFWPEAIEWNDRASDLQERAKGVRHVHADFSSALLLSRLGYKYDAVRAFARLTDYLRAAQPANSNWLHKACVYQGVTAEEMRDLEAARAALQDAGGYAINSEQRQAASNHLHRVDVYMFPEKYD